MANVRLMIRTWWISLPRRRSATRRCQYAWAPAPKITTVCTRVRLEKRRDDATAVRKAVSVVAERKAWGLP